METTSFHGSKITFSMAAILVLAICTVVASYSLKKTSQLKYWSRANKAYSLQLEQENQIAKSQVYAETK